MHINYNCRPAVGHPHILCIVSGEIEYRSKVRIDEKFVGSTYNLFKLLSQSHTRGTEKSNRIRFSVYRAQFFLSFFLSFFEFSGFKDAYSLLQYALIKPLILLHVHPLLGNGLVNKFPRRQILGKQFVARLRNNRRGCVFYAGCAEQRWNNGVMQPVSKQRLCKHTSA
jgi:hypothetical protein